MEDSILKTIEDLYEVKIRPGPGTVDNQYIVEITQPSLTSKRQEGNATVFSQKKVAKEILELIEGGFKFQKLQAAWKMKAEI